MGISPTDSIYEAESEEQDQGKLTLYALIVNLPYETMQFSVGFFKDRSSIPDYLDRESIDYYIVEIDPDQESEDVILKWEEIPIEVKIPLKQVLELGGV